MGTSENKSNNDHVDHDRYWIYSVDGAAGVGLSREWRDVMAGTTEETGATLADIRAALNALGAQLLLTNRLLTMLVAQQISSDEHVLADQRGVALLDILGLVTTSQHLGALKDGDGALATMLGMQIDLLDLLVRGRNMPPPEDGEDAEEELVLVPRRPATEVV